MQSVKDAITAIYVKKRKILTNIIYLINLILRICGKIAG